MIRGEAVVRLLRRLCRPGGLVIVLEDLHWADPDTLAVTEYLADNLAAEPVLCLATSRDEPPSAGLEMIRRLHGRRAAAHLHLGRLTGDQVTAMVRSCLPDAGDDVVARVQRTADGVPFLVEEVLAAPGVPASFRDTVLGRLAGFGEAETSGAGGRHGARAPFRLAAARSHQWAAARTWWPGPWPEEWNSSCSPRTRVSSGSGTRSPGKLWPERCCRPAAPPWPPPRWPRSRRPTRTWPIRGAMPPPTSRSRPGTPAGPGPC